MIGPVNLLLGLGCFVFAGGKSIVESARFSAENAAYEKELREGHFNEELEDEHFRYIQKYGRTMSGIDLRLIPFGYGTPFVHGIMHRDLYYLNLEMAELGYDCKRYIISKGYLC